jgi:hypothetical protein
MNDTTRQRMIVKLRTIIKRNPRTLDLANLEADYGILCAVLLEKVEELEERITVLEHK